MAKDPDKLKLPPDIVEQLTDIGREDRKLAEALRDAQRRLGLENRDLAVEIREAEQRLRQAPASKGYDAPRRNVLCSIMRERFGPNGPPADVSTYSLMELIKSRWVMAWCRLYPERKPPRVPGKGTAAAARKALKNLSR